MQGPLPISRKLRWMLSPRLGTAVRWLRRDPGGLRPRNTHRAAGLLLRAAATSVAGRLGPRARTGPSLPPVFILGFWRSGTTWLHELLALDPRAACPTTYDCLASTHAHWSAERALPFLAGRFASRRPMDAMEIRADSPMEDEFFFLNQGLRSFYELFLFPREGARHLEALDPDRFPEAEREAWLQGLRRLLALLDRNGARRAVLKSPAHAFRIQFLLRHFPEARFIHIHRDPPAALRSTCHTWRVNTRLYALDPASAPQEDGAFEALALACHRRHGEAVAAGRALAGPERWADLAYEDLCADPPLAVQKLYARFGWEGFEALRPALEADRAARAGYRVNAFPPAVPGRTLL